VVLASLATRGPTGGRGCHVDGSRTWQRERGMSLIRRERDSLGVLQAKRGGPREAGGGTLSTKWEEGNLISKVDNERTFFVCGT